ncbi:hypothetical protein ACVBIO_18035 [Shewanella sp. 0m-8]
MIYVGQYIVDEKQGLALRVCHVSHACQQAAVADMNIADIAINIAKPDIYSFDELHTLLKKNSASSSQHQLPAEMSYSDKVLIGMNRDKWLEKRDKKFALIEPLTSEALIAQYLYRGGLSEEITALLTSNMDTFPEMAWTTRGAYYNALNRYIVFGCQVNALLPFKNKNIGRNYLIPASPGANNVKRGRGGANNTTSRSKSIGITQLHKAQLSKIVAYMKSKDGKKWFPKFTFKKAIELYQYQYETSVVERNIENTTHETRIPFEETQSLSQEQIRYHLKSIVDKKLYLQIRHGQISYEKDFADRQGAAHDGVIGATYRYEIDATVLDLYVRYPFDVSGQYSMGRPVLYFVIDVYSTMIVGFYLGFDGPNWEGASQALLNACSCKVTFSARYGVSISERDWPAHHIPVQVTVDNGTEHPDKIILSVLQSELGIRGYNFTAVFRGDAKGTVESKFNCINNESIHFTAGAIPEAAQRGEQHASNRAFWDYDSLIAEIIQSIILHNNTADRLHRLDINAIRTNIDITPNALYLHSLKQEMNGGRDGRLEDAGRLRWAFLPEEEATVRADGIYFKGLVYYSGYAKKAGWFSKAKHDKPFKIPIKRPKDWTSNIWHKTDSNQYVAFDLKNVNDESPFVGQHWEPVLHLLEQFKDKRHKNRLNAKKLRVFKQQLTEQLKLINEELLQGVKENTRISMQPRVKERQAQFKAMQQLKHAIEAQEALMNGNKDDSFTTNIGQLDDLDNEMYE